MKIPFALPCALAAALAACVPAARDQAGEGPGAAGLKIFKQTFHKKDRIRQYRFFESDSAGTTFRSSLRSSDGAGDDLTQQFERRGNTVTVTTYGRDLKRRGSIVQEFDPATGLIAKQSVHGVSGELESYTEFRYDAGGNMLGKTSRDAKGRLHGNAFEFDATGRLVKDLTHEKGALARYTVHEYDARGDLVKRTRFGGDGKVQSYQTYRYDERGNLVEHANFSPSGALVWKVARDFDAGGNKTKVHYYESGAGGAAVLTSYREFTYENNRLAKVTSRGKDGTVLDSGAYEYDSRGNKVKQAYYDGAGRLTGFSTYDYETGGGR
ncbi:MAG TPA: hypothetical protein PKY31_11690 [Spirochaetota bacterium]|nr:hypothetical protein [Spirochaetota bacterium]